MSISTERDVTNDEHWLDFAHQWMIRPDTVYLNHGSFGPPPQYVRQRRRKWIDAIDHQPMDFFDRQLESELWKTREKLAAFVGANTDDLILVDNATYGMNIIADSFPLRPGDEVLTNNHEYGAVHRIWTRACGRKHSELKVAHLPQSIESVEQVVDFFVSQISDRTKILVISHITSPTALIMPIKEICAVCAERGIATVVDGPHAPAHIDIDIAQLGCDFYTASCHKWLCATLGSGFLFVAQPWQDHIQPPIQSWGRLLPGKPEKWSEEFTWLGTRDVSAFLSIGDAIDYFNDQIGLDDFRSRSQYLASCAQNMLAEEFGTEPIADREQGWYGSMAHVPLPNGDCGKLQAELWTEYGIEVPIIYFDDRWYVRVSCHLYNNRKQLESLVFAMRKFIL